MARQARPYRVWLSLDEIRIEPPAARLSRDEAVALAAEINRVFGVKVTPVAAWTPDAKEKLKLLYAEGISLAAIATMFNKSVGAVAQEIGRLGINNRQDRTRRRQAAKATDAK